MERFLRESQVWPMGTTRLHVYLTLGVDVDQDPNLAHLVADYAAVMADRQSTDPDLAVVPPAWMHATVAAIRSPAAGDIDDATRTALAGELRQALGTVQPFACEVGPALATRVGVLLDATADREFDTLVEASQAAIRRVLGPDVDLGDPRPIHISLAYAAGAGDGDRLGSRLRRVRPGRARVLVDSLALVDVRQIVEESAYRWTRLADLPLGAERS
jgi:hypothetical protein